MQAHAQPCTALPTPSKALDFIGNRRRAHCQTDSLLLGREAITTFVTVSHCTREHTNAEERTPENILGQ